MAESITECTTDECLAEDASTMHIMVSGKNNTLNFCSCCLCGEEGGGGEPGGGLTRDEVQEMIDRALGNIAPATYALCEFYYFRNPALRAGFKVADGSLVEDAAELYPKAWAYLQSAEGQALCKTEEEWQAMRHATWATLADGTEVGWNGVGGAPFYALNLETGALRLPDIRGMYVEGAGFDDLDVGGIHGDAVREIRGEVQSNGYNTKPSASGSLAIEINNSMGNSGTTMPSGTLSFTASRVVPTANKNQPRAWGALPCVYLGSSE